MYSRPATARSLGACNVLSDQKEIALWSLNHKAHVDDVNLERAKSKTAFWRGFKYGAVVTGFIGRNSYSLHLKEKWTESGE